MDLDSASILFKKTHERLIQEYSFLKLWSSAFDHANRRAGVCKLTEKEISISLKHIKNNSEETVLDTILHEFAHAIAFELHQETGHGVYWKKIASKVGAKPKATGSFIVPEAPWVLIAYCSTKQTIERVAPRFRRNKQIKKYALKGRPKTQGKLYYLNAEELTQFESGAIGIEQLNFIQ